MITLEQLRMARAALNISQGTLAEAIGVGVMAIGDIESGKTKNPKGSTLAAMIAFYEEAGLEFTEQGGVRPYKAEIKVYRGDVGFQAFYNDVYKIAKAGGVICIQNGMPDDLIRHLGRDFYDMHCERMTRILPNVRVLIKERDRNLIGSSFAQYRAIKHNIFNDQTIYIYGDKVAFITFGKEVETIVIDKKPITDSLKISFKLIWDSADDVH